MKTLDSAFFNAGDKVMVERFEDCANGTPTEATSHFTAGEKNVEAVKRLQFALKAVGEMDPSLQLPPFAVNGIYDAAFANAVLVYKKKRDIKNYAGQYDNIVGKKTIKSLNDEVAQFERKIPRHHKAIQPDRPKDNGEGCLTDDKIPNQTNFTIQLIAGGTGGEIFEAGMMTFAIVDPEHKLSCFYTLVLAGLGTPGLPISPSGGGAPVPFVTAVPTRITRFGPHGTLTSFNFIPPGAPPIGPWVKQIVNTLAFSFRGQIDNGAPAGMVMLNKFDTGPLPNVAGGSVHGGHFKLFTKCQGKAGALKI